MSTPSLHDHDFYAWTVEQARLLSHGHWDKLDFANGRDLAIAHATVLPRSTL
ncbi:MAG: DUF29 family protein [Nodosilinea sp.]